MHRIYKPVIVESPYGGNVEANLLYLDRCILDSIGRLEAPIASHRMYTSALNDNDPDDRKLGIALGFAYRSIVELSAFYLDRGVSAGMFAGYLHCRDLDRPVSFRMLGGGELSREVGPAAFRAAAAKGGFIV